MKYQLKEICDTLAVANHYPPRENAELDAQLRKEMQSDVTWLLEELDRVWGYAYHLNDCAVVDSPANRCTCGLNDLESGNV